MPEQFCLRQGIRFDLFYSWHRINPTISRLEARKSHVHTLLIVPKQHNNKRSFIVSSQYTWYSITFTPLPPQATGTSTKNRQTSTSNENSQLFEKCGTPRSILASYVFQVFKLHTQPNALVVASKQLTELSSLSVDERAHAHNWLCLFVWSLYSLSMLLFWTQRDCLCSCMVADILSVRLLYCDWPDCVGIWDRHSHRQIRNWTQPL